jgi:hypothetical protein
MISVVEHSSKSNRKVEAARTFLQDSFGNIKIKLAAKQALEAIQVEIQAHEGLYKRPVLTDVVQRLIDTYTALPRQSTEMLPRNEEEERLVLGLLRLFRDDQAPEQLKHALATLLSPWINRHSDPQSSKKRA